MVRFSEAARELGLPTVFGAELSLDLPGPQNGEPDPAGAHLLVLARGPRGYARLSRVIADAQLAGEEKGRPVYDLDEVAAGAARTRCSCSPAAARGWCPRALLTDGVAAAARELDRLTALFGAEHVVVELTDHGDPCDGERNDALAALAARAGLPTVATNNVHYATPGAAAAGHRAGRGPGPAQPGRDRRLAARRRPPRTCAAATRWRAGSRRTRARWPGPPSSPRSSPSTCPWSRRSCPTTRCRPGTPRCPGCAS